MQHIIKLDTLWKFSLKRVYRKELVSLEQERNLEPNWTKFRKEMVGMGQY
jgi:hypothetical protein